MITKAFLSAKEIRAMRTKILRANKFIRDHGESSGTTGSGAGMQGMN
jgi:hypothetical protein